MASASPPHYLMHIIISFCCNFMYESYTFYRKKMQYFDISIRRCIEHVAQGLRSAARVEGPRGQDAPDRPRGAPVRQDLHPQEVRGGTVREHGLREPRVGEGHAPGLRPRPGPQEDSARHSVHQGRRHLRGRHPARPGRDPGMPRRHHIPEVLLRGRARIPCGRGGIPPRGGPGQTA